MLLGCQAPMSDDEILERAREIEKERNAQTPITPKSTEEPTPKPTEAPLPQYEVDSRHLILNATYIIMLSNYTEEDLIRIAEKEAKGFWYIYFFAPNPPRVRFKDDPSSNADIAYPDTDYAVASYSWIGKHLTMH